MTVFVLDKMRHGDWFPHTPFFVRVEVDERGVLTLLDSRFGEMGTWNLAKPRQNDLSTEPPMTIAQAVFALRGGDAYHVIGMQICTMRSDPRWTTEEGIWILTGVAGIHLSSGEAEAIARALELAQK